MDKIISTRRTLFRFAAPVFGALACAAMLGGMATPASARDWDHGRDWRAQERHEDWRAHEAWRWQRPYDYRYAPRYYAPAPVYGYGAPSLSVVIPFHTR